MRLLLAVFLILGFSRLFADPPSALYLSLQGDPTSSMVIQWHTPVKEGETSLFFREEGEKEWQVVGGEAERLEKSSLLVHTVELTHLNPDTVYYFHLGSEKSAYKFRTCPKTLHRRVRFAVAGDAYFYLYPLRKINKEIAKADPDFVVIGGDIAYTNGHKSLFKGKDWESKRWGTFFKEWQKQMVAPDGRLIPMVVVVGNHDVRSRAPYNMFSTLFYGASTYRAYDFGDYLSLICLDTGHLIPIEGTQTQWLESTLSSRRHFSYKLGVYHVGAYPSVYPYEGRVPTLIRQNWVPLFEKYGLQYAFENHNHAYKRTYPIREGRVDSTGVVYLGDGSWGVTPRKPKTPDERWYLAKAAQVNCFWLVTLDQKGCHLKSINREGKTIEELPAIMDMRK